MLEQLRSPGGRIAIGLVASAMILALALLVSDGMIALAPVLLVPVWASLFADNTTQPRPGLLKLALAFGVAAFVAFFVPN